MDYTYTYESTNNLTNADAAGILGVIFLFWGIALIFSLAAYVVSSISLMKIFDKAGVPGWAAWVPFYNTWKMLEIGGQQGFWAVLSIIPVVNIASAVFLYIAMYHIGLKLGKSGSFILFGIFLPIVWMLWLAFDKSIWNDSASTAPSLAGVTPPTNPTPPATPTV